MDDPLPLLKPGMKVGYRPEPSRYAVATIMEIRSDGFYCYTANGGIAVPWHEVLAPF